MVKPVQPATSMGGKSLHGHSDPQPSAPTRGGREQAAHLRAQDIQPARSLGGKKFTAEEPGLTRGAGHSAPTSASSGHKQDVGDAMESKDLERRKGPEYRTRTDQSPADHQVRQQRHKDDHKPFPYSDQHV